MSHITFEEFKSKSDHALNFLKEELKKIRSGRATTGLVEDIKVEAYGDMQPIKNLASITVADPTLLVIQPWDKGLIPSIAKAIQGENIGMNPQVSGDLVRVPMPSLTEERRKEYVKIMREKLEEGRISIRTIRKDVMIGLQAEKENGDITEDDFDRFEKELQKMVDSSNQEIESTGESKEKELMSF